MPRKQFKNAIKLDIPFFEVMDPPIIKTNSTLRKHKKVDVTKKTNMELFTLCQKRELEDS